MLIFLCCMWVAEFIHYIYERCGDKKAFRVISHELLFLSLLYVWKIWKIILLYQLKVSFYMQFNILSGFCHFKHNIFRRKNKMCQTSSIPFEIVFKEHAHRILKHLKKLYIFGNIKVKWNVFYLGWYSKN